MAELTFFTGTMDCGKSTLALQTDYNHRRRGLAGLMMTSHDRAGEATVSSRLGLSADAVEVAPATQLWALVAERLAAGARIDYVIADEAQFYTSEQVDDLGRMADELDVPVYAFGILTDFRTRLFPGSARLVELADRVETLQVEALCWCGRRATHNARTVGGIMVTEGEQVVVGDTDGAGVVGYEVLCRHHHRRRMTAASARVAEAGAEPLPFATG
ncbi:thymidine kinase [Jiangella endophytica]|uniref:thymidine kinase n=1 Tax=Jiangella endophytica TaxID=1623398 RepID=UPI000E35041F|nr:thymidine kinase [Jiangella endophytica]